MHLLLTANDPLHDIFACLTLEDESHFALVCKVVYKLFLEKYSSYFLLHSTCSQNFFNLKAKNFTLNKHSQLVFIVTIRNNGAAIQMELKYQFQHLSSSLAPLGWKHFFKVAEQRDDKEKLQQVKELLGPQQFAMILKVNKISYYDSEKKGYYLKPFVCKAEILAAQQSISELQLLVIERTAKKIFTC